MYVVVFNLNSKPWFAEDIFSNIIHPICGANNQYISVTVSQLSDIQRAMILRSCPFQSNHMGNNNEDC